MAHWQDVFDDSETLFAELADGARMGLIAQPGFAPGGRRLAGLEAAAAKYAGMPMLAFDAAAGRIAVTLEPFESFDQAGLDLLFVADEEARGELAATRARGHAARDEAPHPARQRDVLRLPDAARAAGRRIRGFSRFTRARVSRGVPMIFRNPAGAPELACEACGCRWFDRMTNACYECGCRSCSGPDGSASSRPRT